MFKLKKIGGRNLALTILLGVFIAIMVIILFNLIVDYVYPSPEYDKICNGAIPYSSPVKELNNCCNFSKELQVQQDKCYLDKGNPIFEYDNKGCAAALKSCDMCNQNFQDKLKEYNRQTFFVFAGIGFILIVFGLFISSLLLQLISLSAGAVLVIEAGVKNFDDKLSVIIVFSLLIIAALYLALKKLGEFKK